MEMKTATNSKHANNRNIPASLQNIERTLRKNNCCQYEEFPAHFQRHFIDSFENTLLFQICFIRGGYAMAQCLTCAVLLLMMICPAWSQSSSPLLLKNVNIVALGGGLEQTNREVLLENGKIVSIRPASNKPFPGIEQIEAANKWLVPGLIDLHVQLAYAAADSVAAHMDLAELLAEGITSVLDLSGSHVHQESAPRNSGSAHAPNVFAGSALFPSTPALPQPAPGAFFAKNEQEARQAVRAAKKLGATLIYLDARLENDEVKAALQEAQALNLPTAGAALGYSFEDAARNGLNVLYDINSLVVLRSEEASANKLRKHGPALRRRFMA
jgi:hypothetical protein